MTKYIYYKNRDGRRVFLSILILISSLLVACSSNYPTEADGRKAFSEQHQGLLKINSFRKTDGKPMEAFGVKMYVMSFEAEVECLGAALTTTGVFCLQSGETKKIQNSVRFEKTEQGWRAVR
jgi:hypothetical protein